jgi:hypothetical protein
MEKKTRTPRPLTLATKKAIARLIADNQDRLNEMVAEEMRGLGYEKASVEKWGPIAPPTD